MFVFRLIILSPTLKLTWVPSSSHYVFLNTEIGRTFSTQSAGRGSLTLTFFSEILLTILTIILILLSLMSTYILLSHNQLANSQSVPLIVTSLLYKFQRDTRFLQVKFPRDSYPSLILALLSYH